MKLPAGRLCAAKSPHCPLAGCEGVVMGWILTSALGVVKADARTMAMSPSPSGLGLVRSACR